jgi:hypothetical protein
MGRVVGIVLVLALAGCGAGGPGAGAPQPREAGPPLYEANGTVLQARPGEPMLCLGGVLLSLPPQCGDVPLDGWDWDAVGGEETHGRTTWGRYRLVGTYDGETFAVREVGRYEGGRGDAEPDWTPACPEPEGGWTSADASHSQEDVAEAQTYAAAQDEYAASWVFHLLDRGGDPDEQREDLVPVVYNVVFTGNAARHEAEIRKRWAGPLCVVERDVPSEREARRIRAEAEASLDELGVRMLWSDEGTLVEAAQIGVVADPGGEAQVELDARYGPGLVRLVPALRPLE